MLLSGKWPSMEEMEKGMKLENLPSCSPQEALDKLEKDKKTLRQVLEGVTQKDFTNKVVSVPWGWKGKMELMAIHFLEHFTNHKMQLFTYLKLLGLPVNTQTLYGM
jgi:ribosomal protein L6P/L9E